MQESFEIEFELKISNSQVADEDDSASDSESHQSEDENDSAIRNMEQDSAEQKEDSTQKQQPQEHPQILALGRSNFGRSLALNPVQLPGNAEIQEAERAECKFFVFDFHENL